ncbi:MAG: rhodanese-like domain-containing protein [Elusimicrobiales bacterium]|nr:rhodanese-like domain-containing protein [Elusimicrobiales bacterium]
MKILLVIVFVVFAAAAASAFDFGGLFTGCGKPHALKDLATAEVPAAPAAEPKPGDRDFPLNIKPAQVRDYLEQQRPVFIDVRTPEEHAAGYIEKTDLVIDFKATDFKDKLSKLDRNVKYLIYCRSGHRSGLALAMMKDLGFAEYHDIEGGINAWTAAGLPVVK